MTYTHIRGIQNGDTVWVLTRHRSLHAAKRSTVRPYLTGQYVILGRAVFKPIP